MERREGRSVFVVFCFDCVTSSRPHGIRPARVNEMRSSSSPRLLAVVSISSCLAYGKERGGARRWVGGRQGRFWIVHLQKACCGRRCKLWSKDGRGSTDSHEVKFLFMISACAASSVRICIGICNNVSFWLCEPTFLRSKLAKVSYILKKQNSVEKNFCIF